jgi:hypothetical protein
MNQAQRHSQILKLLAKWRLNDIILSKSIKNKQFAYRFKITIKLYLFFSNGLKFGTNQINIKKNEKITIVISGGICHVCFFSKPRSSI